MAVVAGKIAAIVCSIVGPTFAVLVWLSVTFSHREEKHIVTCGVIQHIAVSEITGSSAAAQARSLWSNQDPPMIQPSPPRKFPFKLPLTWAAFSHPSSHSGHSAFLSGQPNASDGHQGLNNGLSGQDYLSSSIQLAGMTHTTAASGTAGSSTLGRLSPSMQSCNLISASRSPATAYSHNIHQVLSHQPVHKSTPFPSQPLFTQLYLPYPPPNSHPTPVFSPLSLSSTPPPPTLPALSGASFPRSLLPALPPDYPTPYAHAASVGVLTAHCFAICRTLPIFSPNPGFAMLL